MPQLPPVAAAAFVLCLLAGIAVITVVAQMRARRRRLMLAAMVRDSAPIPRPSVSTVDPSLMEALEAVPTPLRGQHYQRAEREGRFQPFDDRPATREGAPGRPGRRLAAQVAYAAPVASPPPPPILEPPVVTVAPEVVLPVADAEAPAVTPPAVPAPLEVLAEPPVPEVAPDLPISSVLPTTVAEQQVARSHAGLESVSFDLDVSRGMKPEIVEVGDEARTGDGTGVAGQDARAELTTAAEVLVSEPLAGASLAPEFAPESEPEAVTGPAGEAASPASEGAHLDQGAPPEPEPVVPATAFVDEPANPGAGTPAEPIPARAPSDAPRERREPEVRVLVPRAHPSVPALPALMTREVSLGEAARVLRGVLPGALTMTDGRQIRRAVAVGAATSVVAAAFAIRGRKRG